MLQSNGHLNVLVRDHDSYVTGHGKHDRVVAFCPQGNEMYCRVDHKWNLGAPTPTQILKVAKRDNGNDQRGRWVLDRAESWGDGKSTDYYFKRAQSIQPNYGD